MNNFLKKFMGFSIGPIVGALISLFTVPITTYFIVPSEFGKASMVTIIQSLVLSFIYLGIDQAYSKEYHYVDDKKKLFQNALLLPLLFSILFVVIISFFAEEFSMILFNDVSYSNISILFGISIIFMVVERFILLSLRMEERTLEYSFFNIIVKVIILGFTLIYLYKGERDFLVVVYSTIYGQLFSNLLQIILYRKLFIIEKDFLNKQLMIKMLLFGLPLIIAASVSNLLNSSSRFFLRIYSTYESIGVYSAALKVSNVIQILQLAFTTFWIPTAYRWKKEKKEIKHFKIISDGLLLIMTILFFVLLLFKNLIIYILSPGYSEAQYIIGLLSLTPVLYTLSETTTLGIVFSGKSYYNLYVSILSLVPNVILNILLIPKFGINGAAIATGVSYVFFYLGRTYFSEKCGFKVASSKQIFSVFLLLIAGIINLSSNSIFVFSATVILLILSISIQKSTIKTAIDIYKNPNDWDFE